MDKQKVIAFVIISVLTISAVLFALKKEGVFEKDDIDDVVINLLGTIDIEDKDYGYERFSKLFVDPNKKTLTKEKYIELRNNKESSYLYEHYYLVKYTTKNYLLIRYQKKGDKIELLNIKIVPNEFKELFAK